MKIQLDRPNDPKWQFNVEWSDDNFDIYENNVELSHLYVDMSKFMITWYMAHGTVKLTCFNHKMVVVILHKVNIWQVVEGLCNYNFQMACLKHIIWSNCNRHSRRNPCLRGFATHTIYIYKSRLYVKLMFWFFYSALMYTWSRNWKMLNNMFSVLKLLKILEKKDMRL